MFHQLMLGNNSRSTMRTNDCSSLRQASSPTRSTILNPNDATAFDGIEFGGKVARLMKRLSRESIRARGRCGYSEGSGLRRSEHAGLSTKRKLYRQVGQ